MAVNVAMITWSFPAAQRGQALGINAVLVALGVSVGPTVGGLLIEVLGWQWILYVNVPICGLLIAVAWYLLTERARWERQHFDLGGAAALAVGLSALTLGLSFGQEWGWASGRVLLAITVAMAALIGAFWLEHRTPFPLLDPVLLRNRVFVLANVSFMIAMLALFAVSFLLPFYSEELRGYSTLRSALLLTPLPLTIAVVAPLSGTLADRVGIAPACAAWAGHRWRRPLDVVPVDSGDVDRLRRRVPGRDRNRPGAFSGAQHPGHHGAAPPGVQGVASGTLATCRVIGQSLSIAVAGAVFTGSGAAAAGSALAAGAIRSASSSSGRCSRCSSTACRPPSVVCAGCAIVGVVTALARQTDSDVRDPHVTSRASAHYGKAWQDRGLRHRPFFRTPTPWDFPLDLTRRTRWPP